MSNSPQNQDLLEEFKAALESDDSEKNYNMLKAVVNTLPAGPLLGGFLESYVVSPAMKRRDTFLGILVRELMALKSKIESVDFGSPVFLTTFLHASHIAYRTHKEQKLEALRNVVLNSSIPSSVEDDVLVAIFLNWIDDFTELHISTLKCLHYLSGYTPDQLREYFPMLEQKRAWYNQVLKDLEDRGLISLREDYITTEEHDNHRPQWVGFPIAQIGPNGNPVYDISTNERKMKTSKDREDIDDILGANSLYGQESKTTELGEQFIKFIECPPIA
jgi:hypothetical protein